MAAILAADLAANEWTALSAAAVPFLAAIAFFLISPLLTDKVKAAVRGQIAEGAMDHKASNGKASVNLNHESVNSYIEYAMDAVQIIPLTLLPVTGAVFAIAARVPGQIALGYLGIAILAAVAVEAWVLSQTAGEYVSKRFHKPLVKRYSVVTVAGMVSNILGLVMILIYRL